MDLVQLNTGKSRYKRNSFFPFLNFFYNIQGRNPTFVRGNGSKFEISLGAGCKSQLLGGMTYTVRDGFYALTWTFILVLTYFGKKIPKNHYSPT